MITFDDILPALIEKFSDPSLPKLRPMLINRDLYGRISLVVEGKWKDTDNLDLLTSAISKLLGAHAYPDDELIFFVESLEPWLNKQTKFPLESHPEIFVVDRLAVESAWAVSAKTDLARPRIVYYSIKGGVGRSTALAATAWSLARQDKSVLVLDLDLESPGLSSALLGKDRQPKFGITDWLVEDLVDQGDELLDHMSGLSDLSKTGQIRVVPAHGSEPGEYLAKLGRVYMAKTDPAGGKQVWTRRLERLIDALESKYQPDVTLIDARSGIDEIASACVTDIPNTLVLMFALDDQQTWFGFRALFRHWRRRDEAALIRERLQIVGAMVPELGGTEYFKGLLETSWTNCSEELYDAVVAGEVLQENTMNWDILDEAGPHYPWPVKWHRAFSAMRNMESRFGELEESTIQDVFGKLIKPLTMLLELNE